MIKNKMVQILKKTWKEGAGLSTTIKRPFLYQIEYRDGAHVYHVESIPIIDSSTRVLVIYTTNPSFMIGVMYWPIISLRNGENLTILLKWPFLKMMVTV